MKNRGLAAGIILISIGIMSALETLNLIPGILTMYLLASGFLGAYIFYKRSIGFIIPGCILTAIAVFASIEQRKADIDGVYFLILLGLAFFAVFFIHTIHNKDGRWGERYWPLFPGASLMAIGGLVMSVQNGLLDFNLNYLNLLTPMILVIVGFSMLLRNMKKA